MKSPQEDSWRSKSTALRGEKKNKVSTFQIVKQIKISENLAAWLRLLLRC